MSAKKYVYEGNRDPNNHSTVLKVGGEDYQIGDEVPLSAAERDLLAPYVILTDSGGDDVGEGLTSPTATPADAVVPSGSTSGPEASISGEAGKSAKS